MACKLHFILLFVVVLALHMKETKTVTPAETVALQDLYNSLDGANWIHNKGWLNGDPCVNSWYGVNCTASTTNGHVQALQLQDNELYGSLPSTITNLFLASDLCLRDNKVAGTIPDTIDALRSLQSLDLGENELSGTIPDTMGSLLSYSLSYLDLSRNDLTGLVPSFFSGRESSFSYVNLSGNPFICPLPANCGYTGATCINWTISGISSSCVSGYLPEMTTVYGQGFGTLSGVHCRLSSAGGLTFTTPAIPLTPHMLQCNLASVVNFTNCTGKNGEKIVEMLELVLVTEGGYSISNVLEGIATLNSACFIYSSSGQYYASESTMNYAYINGSKPYSSSGTPTPLRIYIPKLKYGIEMCGSGMQYPCRCPEYITTTGISSVRAIYDKTCAEDSDNCVWAAMGSLFTDPTTTSNNMLCGYCMIEYNSRCYYTWSTSSVPAGTYKTRGCKNFITGPS